MRSQIEQSLPARQTKKNGVCCVASVLASFPLSGQKLAGQGGEARSSGSPGEMGAWVWAPQTLPQASGARCARSLASDLALSITEEGEGLRPTNPVPQTESILWSRSKAEPLYLAVSHQAGPTPSPQLLRRGCGGV